MAALANALSGLSLEVSTSTSGSTIDLAGTSAASAKSSLLVALAPSVVYPEIRRLTFVVSGGKGVRGKYDLSLYKECVAALKEVNYKSEMEGGDESKGGSYKSQHDTGKNLKTLVVFTKPTITEEKGNQESQVVGGALDTSTPDYKAICSSLPIFSKLVSTKAPTWSEKKTLSSVLSVGQELYDILMSEVLRGKTLTGQEQNYVDNFDSVDSKITHLKTEMQLHVKEGKLTGGEKEMLLEQVMEKIEKGDSKLLKRKELLESCKGNFKVEFRNVVLLQKICDDICVIEKIEAQAKGRLMTTKEIGKVAEKEELEEKLEEVLEKERGWWEEDLIWSSRKSTISTFKKKGKQKASKTSSSAKKSAGNKKPAAKSATSWVTPGVGKKNFGVGRGVGGAGVKKQEKPGGLFAAMMDSSDSDSD
ncbi:hypothetical protein TrLO_g9783 [Triparma laevis f. longispina]|uniref:Uncharacterized protein n=1 Tax=Triparma laevis f. longispina TaxID=1714387 RepID=A0A9W7FGY9_9STRA|nr:hypothetical protein TrLO_g9783 [Triparma laevis f. longispina]